MIYETGVAAKDDEAKMATIDSNDRQSWEASLRRAIKMF
jgi:hypothetical protein